MRQMRNITIFYLLVFVMVSLIAGCSGTGARQSNPTILAEVNGEAITVQDLYGNPMFNNAVKQLITEKIIKQEFKSRGLTLDESMVQKEWDNFVAGQGNSEEAANETLKKQGMSKKAFFNSVSIKVMLQTTIEQEKPVTLEDARKEFESNPESTQKLYANSIPEKKDKPETITFEEVADKMMDNMRQRQFSQEWQSTLDTLNNEYKEKGWIKNYVQPEEEEEKGLTKIEKQTTKEQEIDSSRLRRAPMKKQEKEEQAKEDEKGKETEGK